MHKDKLEQILKEVKDVLDGHRVYNYEYSITEESEFPSVEIAGHSFSNIQMEKIIKIADKHDFIYRLFTSYLNPNKIVLTIFDWKV